MAAASAPADAAVFATSKVGVGPQGDQVVCYLFNTVGRAVTISGLRIGDLYGPVSGSAIATDCKTALAGGKGCAISLNLVDPLQAYDCAVTAGSTKGLRGSLEVRAVGATIITEQMR